jgi:thiol-disulfide isomerase/thioredoxin
MFRNVLLFLLCVLPFITSASTGHQITVEIEDFEEDTLLLGYYLMDKQYIQDTVPRQQNGNFVFQGEEEIPAGVYIVVLPPENNFFQILINPGEQHFSIRTNSKDLVGSFRVKGSPDNERFYQYLQFLNDMRPEAEALQKQIEAARKAGDDISGLQKKLDAVNVKVDDYRNKLVEDHPESLSAAVVRSTFEIDMPEFEGSEKEVQVKRYRHYKSHYFDFINLADPRLLRSPILYNRVNYYVEKLTPQHPDSISLSIDFLLEQMKPSEETFKYYLVNFLNKFAKSKIVGMDAVYVHLVENYYAKDLAPWTEEEQLKKIIDNAKKLKPILIGKVAPDLDMKLLDLDGTIEAEDEENEYRRFRTKEVVPLHSVQSPFTVLIFWAPDCGHCKKSMPKLLEFYEAYKNKGVAIYAVCAKTYKDMPSCARFIKEKQLDKWYYNVVDPFLQTKYKTTYDIVTTPQVFILDENKEILSKRIGVEQLSEVMDKLIEFKAREKQENR